MLCAPGSSTKFRDLPPDQQIGGYPPPDALAVEDTVLDSEGRCVVLEFPAFVLLGLYCPATRDATRTEFREAFLDALDLRVRNLISLGKHVVLCGDLNIIRSELDTAGLAEALRKENIPLDDWLSSPARRLFNHLVFGGRVVGALDPGREQPVLWDLGRAFHPTRAGMYTCWETKKNARPGNYGSRIDYVLCSADRRGWFVDANIQEGLLGSDHCPVYATLAATVATPERGQVAIEDFMNPVGMFRDGVRLREWSPKDILPTSARLLPEFDRRRNIRDMFQPKPKETPVVTTPAADTTMPDLPAPPLSSPAGEALSVLPRRTPPVESAAPLKRPAKPASVPSKKAKLAKEAPASKSQQSLMGFFKPTPPAERPTLPDAEPPSSGTPGGSQVSYPGMRSERDAKPEGRDASDDDGQRVIDPFVSRESWSKLLGRRTPPKCEHGDECQMLTTKKPGMNRGTSPPSHFSSSCRLRTLASLTLFLLPSLSQTQTCTFLLGISLLASPLIWGQDLEEKESELYCIART